MTRAEHIRGCKQRALKYLDKGEIQDAVISMLSDLGKNPKTAKLAKSLELVGLVYVVNKDLAGARQFIEGFTE